MTINFLAFLDDALDVIDDSDVLETVLSEIDIDIDFDSLIADFTDVVSGVLSDVDQVVDAVTALVTESLDQLELDSDAVDISNIIEEAVDFIMNLADDVTIADALNDIGDYFSETLPSLSDAQLEQLLTDVSDLINEIAPNLSQLSITPVLEQGVEFITDVTDSEGFITLDGASLVGEITTDGSIRSFSTDVSGDIDNFLQDTRDFLANIIGIASLNDGLFQGDVTINDTPYAISLDITESITDGLTNVLSTADVTLPFVNGVFDVEFSALGDIEGTIDFAGGDLDLDLSTPLGPVDTSLAFPEDAQFDVPVDFLGISELELDLAVGVLRLPILNTTLELPLDSFSGELSLSDGLVGLTLENFPIPVETTFEVGPLASQVAIALTDDLSGELTIDAGEIDGSISSSLGEFSLEASFDDLVLQASSVIDQTTGALTLTDGSALINLTTPFGELSAGLALSDVEDVLVSASELLA